LTARFLEIDDQNRGHHYNLTADDECYFLYEYTSGKNYSFSETNRLVSNLKKRPSLAGTAQYRYKTLAIEFCGRMFGESINPKWLATGTLVPVPPSKARTDPEYDDRISKICRAIPAAGALDVREIVVQTRSLPADHEGGPRHRIEDLLEVYRIDEAKTAPAPQNITVVDDVLTNGTHFRAMKTILKDRFPGASVVGFFIARRVFPNPFEGVLL
jgi:predicted amidophosphoribosyltransferase